jgi:hypothetical protein
MGLLSDVGLVESPFGPLEIVFWMHQMVLRADEPQMEAHFGPFGDSVSFSTR